VKEDLNRQECLAQGAALRWTGPARFTAVLDGNLVGVVEYAT
jgi:hypothetical protein